MYTDWLYAAFISMQPFFYFIRYGIECRIRKIYNGVADKSFYVTG